MRKLKSGTLIQVKEERLENDGFERHGRLWIIEEWQKPRYQKEGLYKCRALATGVGWHWYRYEFVVKK